jgi:Rrf2 family transcriptional regulator, iron-sulfur cluster assembly transcription factor
VVIYSRSVEYAIRAFIHIAGLEQDEYALAKTIAAETGIPSHFLSKILQDLARDGFLKSSKGPHGGFRLRLPAEQISMRRVVEAVDGSERLERCIGGHAECSDHADCGFHDSWMPVRSRIIDYLEGTSIADLKHALGEKRRLLSRTRRAKK